ncbi:hypothetical protein HDU83_001127 [Entophlyctis luteolus]|nr:hypothetical protein HDU83_001127 [Entophlyctis luteolus]
MPRPTARARAAAAMAAAFAPSGGSTFPGPFPLPLSLVNSAPAMPVIPAIPSPLVWPTPPTAFVPARKLPVLKKHALACLQTPNHQADITLLHAVLQSYMTAKKFKNTTLTHWLWILRNLVLCASFDPATQTLPLRERIGVARDLHDSVLLKSFQDSTSDDELGFRYALDLYCELTEVICQSFSEKDTAMRAKLRVQSITPSTNNAHVLRMQAACADILRKIRVSDSAVFTNSSGSHGLFGYVLSKPVPKQGEFDFVVHGNVDESAWRPNELVDAKFLAGGNLGLFLAMGQTLKKLDSILKPGPIVDQETLEDSDSRNLLVANMNPSQKSAVKMALGNKVSVIWGPPGSGKTRTVATLVAQLAKSHPRESVLVTGPTNQAVDAILAQFLRLCGAQDKNLYRIGDPSSVAREHHKYIPAHQASRDRVFPLDKRIFYAPLIFATTASAALSAISTRTFDTVVVDEAAQLPHIQAYTVAVKAAKRLVLVGDDKQLGPVTSSSAFAEDGAGNGSGFDTSLFEMYRCGCGPRGEPRDWGGSLNAVPVALLNEQYRMHGDLAAFSNLQWYGGNIKSAISGDARQPLKCLPFNRSRYAAFIDVFGHEVASDNFAGSVYNKEEAEVVVDVIKGLLKEVSAQNIGVITGYAEQVNCITSLLRDSRIGNIDVRTIDGFQGQERDVIIFSAVKSNGELGFLKDYRRMNVMLTRARQGLVIIGREKTLRTDSVWNALVSRLKSSTEG